MPRRPGPTPVRRALSSGNFRPVTDLDSPPGLRSIQTAAAAVAGSIAGAYLLVLGLHLAGVRPEVGLVPLGLPGFLSLLGVVIALLAPGLIQRKAGFEEAPADEAMDRLRAEVHTLFAVMGGLALAVVLLSFLRGTMLWAHLFVPLSLFVILFQFPTRGRIRKRRGAVEGRAS